MNYFKIKKEWHTVASKMKPWRRIQFLGMITEYAFSRQLPECKSGELYALFMLVRKDIDKIVSYTEKLEQTEKNIEDNIEDNIEKPNEKIEDNSEGNSEEFSQTAKKENSPIPPKIKIINNKNIFVNGGDISPQTKNFIFDFFEKKEIQDPITESERFIAHYTSKNWTLNGGQKITTEKQIRSLLNLWKINSTEIKRTDAKKYTYQEFIAKFKSTENAVWVDAIGEGGFLMPKDDAEKNNIPILKICGQ